MTTEPDEVYAPAGDPILFRVSRSWSLARMFAVALVIYPIVQPLVILALGGDVDFGWVLIVQAVVMSALFAGISAVMRPSPFNTWIRVSAGGLELCAGGRGPVLLTWPDVASVRVRRRGLRTLLEVTPVEMRRVHRADARDGQPPVRDGSFVADVGLLRPGIGVLRRELDRWGAA